MCVALLLFSPLFSLIPVCLTAAWPFCPFPWRVLLIYHQRLVGLPGPIAAGQSVIPANQKASLEYSVSQKESSPLGRHWPCSGSIMSSCCPQLSWRGEENRRRLSHSLPARVLLAKLLTRNIKICYPNWNNSKRTKDVVNNRWLKQQHQSGVYWSVLTDSVCSS